MKSRIVLIFVGFCLLWGFLWLRAASLQVLPNDRLHALRNRQFKTVVTLQARRGAIMDREGRDLALSTPALSVYADPKIIQGHRSAARRLGKILGVRWQNIYARIKNRDRRFVWIERRMDPEKAEKIKALGIRGISLVEEWRRVYPNESVLAHTLGFLGGEGQALEGIELAYDQALRGNLKKVVVRRDARGRPLVADGLLFQQNPDGHDLKLTIDSEIQYMLESELAGAVRDFEADSAMGVVLEADTSAIRAMATVPTFDANKAMKTSPEVRRNRVVTDAFEPGSTFKPFVVAEALREKKLQPNSKYFAENGLFKVADRTIRDAGHKYGWLSVSEILAFSSNIGTVKIAFQVGAESYRKALLDFGFGARTGTDLPGEARGSVQSLPWGQHLLSNISFGHGVATTPLQLANGFASLVNGGRLNTPYVVEGIRDAETGVMTETERKTVRQVLTPEQSAQMRLMLTGVTAPGGTGVNAKVNGFIVGGKTGTAQKVDPKGRGYLPGAYISSFVGFVPAHDPKFVIYIVVDQPRKAYYGSQVAAPIFSRIASYAARKEGLAPVLLSERNLIRKKIGRAPASETEEPLVLASDLLKTRDPVEIESVPDLSKLTVREVLRQVSGKDLKIKMIGRKGMVSETIPGAGEPVPEDREITVILK
ncbi:MAG TPA: penicillin-binding transpeptidase domain-containing protein [Pseudobdellovibrionaceae bacterium]|nr:penicillin-binding transpeptidase domain-containing protein [Pseudobdellovibrionaceae bacterium]